MSHATQISPRRVSEASDENTNTWREKQEGILGGGAGKLGILSPRKAPIHVACSAQHSREVWQVGDHW